MSSPPVTLIRQNDTHRLIPCKYSVDGESVLTKIADSDQHLKELFDLDFATNDRLAAENNRLPGISSHELVFGVPQYRVINATFTHAHPSGSRFNSSERGAWYAAFELATSQAEIIFHKTQEYIEINRFDDSVSYDDYLADFSGEFHDVRDAAAFTKYLNPESYVASQKLAEKLLELGSLGIVYPSVRRKSGTCLVCFRPPAVGNVRKNYRYCLTWAGKPTPKVTCLTFDSKAN
jgi:RES domain-containing protein